MGNPNWQKNGPSPNPGGRPKIDAAFRLRARKIVDAKVIGRWERELDEDGPEWLKCSELLAAYAYGRPTSTIDVSAEQSGKDELSLDWSLLSREEVIEVARMSKDAQKSSHAEQARLYELMTKTVPKSLSMAAKLALELAIADLAGMSGPIDGSTPRRLGEDGQNCIEGLTQPVV